MKNQYVGDVGDFGKFGMLRYLSKTSLSLGINWYLSYDDSSNDGNKTSYLNDPKYRTYDPELCATLYKIINDGNKSIYSIENSNLFPSKTIYYNIPLDIPQNISYKDKIIVRKEWHKNALKKLSDADIIFLDPDTGIEIPSTSLTSKCGNKYVGFNELKDYLLLNKSCIVYVQRRHSSQAETFNIYKDLQYRLGLYSISMITLTYRGGGIRDFIFFIQPQHTKDIINSCNEFVQTPWQDYFSYTMLAGKNNLSIESNT